MHFRLHRKRRTPGVIIVSLIDVLIVVLIFLMISTTLRKKEEPVLKLALPESKAASEAPAVQSKPFLIQVTTEYPYFFLGSRAVTFDRLQAELVSAVKANPKLSVAIKADKRAPVGEIVKIIDASKMAQVAGINILTEKAPAR